MKHPDYLNLTSQQHKDWRDYWQLEPWGEKRSDWRTLAYHVRWLQVHAGSNREPPKPVWPYFDDEHHLDPHTVMESTAAFEEAIEPRPDGKGYQYTEAAKRRMREMGLWEDGDDNRQT